MLEKRWSKNEKSLKKDGRKNHAQITLEKIFFVHLFSTIFHFLIIFFQAFNPPLDDFWPILINWRRKDKLLALSNLQVNENEICPGNLFSNNVKKTISVPEFLSFLTVFFPVHIFQNICLAFFRKLNLKQNQIQIPKILLKLV